MWKEEQKRRDSTSEITRICGIRVARIVSEPSGAGASLPAFKQAGRLFSASVHSQIASSKRRDGRSTRRTAQHPLPSFMILRRTGVHKFVFSDQDERVWRQSADRNVWT
jgi:hypothetical protein